MKTCWGITKRIKFCKKPTGGKLLCDQHKSQPKYFVIIAIAGVLFSYVAGIIPKLPLPWENDVYVSPSSVDFHKGDWAAKTPLSVCNRKDKSIHSVYVKIGLVGEGITSESVICTVPNKSTNLEARVGDISFSSDTYRVNAIDSSGREAVFIVLHTIPAGTCREFIVSGSTEVQSHATVSIVSFTEVPKPVLESSKGAMVLFTPPEDIKIKSIDLIVSKKHT